MESDADDLLFETANLYPRTTGLPMTMWVRPRGHALHAARVQVARTGGDLMVPDDVAVVTVGPPAALAAGALGDDALGLVVDWVGLNRAALIEHWDGRIDAADLASRLRRL